MIEITEAQALLIADSLNLLYDYLEVDKKAAKSLRPLVKGLEDALRVKLNAATHS